MYEALIRFILPWLKFTGAAGLPVAQNRHVANGCASVHGRNNIYKPGNDKINRIFQIWRLDHIEIFFRQPSRSDRRDTPKRWLFRALPSEVRRC